MSTLTSTVPRSETLPRLVQVLVFMGILWAIVLVDPAGDLHRYGILPRSQDGLVGILAVPLLHANWMHVAANSVTLGCILLQRAMAPWHDLWWTTGYMWVLSGALIWALHPDTDGARLVGASALAFAWLSHSLAYSFDAGDVIGPTVLGAQIWLFWPFWEILLFPNDIGVSWIGHWIGAAVGAWTYYAHGSSVG